MIQVRATPARKSIDTEIYQTYNHVQAESSNLKFHKSCSMHYRFTTITKSDFLLILPPNKFCPNQLSKQVLGQLGCLGKPADLVKPG